MLYPLSIEFQCVWSMPPLQFTRFVADLGCQHLSIALEPFPFNPANYPPYSLRTDAKLRRDFVSAMADAGVSPSLGEGLCIFPGHDVRDHLPAAEIMKELGVPKLNVVSFEPDRQRSFDHLGKLAEMAGTLGMETVVEFVPPFTMAGMGTATAITKLEDAIAAIAHVGRPDCRIMIDTMHLIRSGGTPDQLATIDPAAIGYLQLCDIALPPRFDDYLDEASERMVPGTGNLPLRAILERIPKGTPMGLEVPIRSLAEAGVPPEVPIGQCVEATRRMRAETGHDQGQELVDG